MKRILKLCWTFFWRWLLLVLLLEAGFACLMFAISGIFTEQYTVDDYAVFVVGKTIYTLLPFLAAFVVIMYIKAKGQSIICYSL
jgi:hypothetical protein